MYCETRPKVAEELAENIIDVESWVYDKVTGDVLILKQTTRRGPFTSILIILTSLSLEFFRSTGAVVSIAHPFDNTLMDSDVPVVIIFIHITQCLHSSHTTM